MAFAVKRYGGTVNGIKGISGFADATIIMSKEQ